MEKNILYLGEILFNHNLGETKEVVFFFKTTFFFFKTAVLEDG